MSSEKKTGERSRFEMKKRILVIDDNEDLRHVTRVFLEQAGMEVLESKNNKETLQICSQQQVHLLVMDVFLGNELSLDAALEMAKDPAYYGRPKIIAVSGTIGGELIKSKSFLVENHIDCFLKKPFHFNELVDKINELLQ